MTYPELKIALDIGDPKTVLSSIIDPYNREEEDFKYCGMYFIVCDDGDCHCFDENGKEQRIDYIPYYCFARQLFKKIIIPETVKNIGHLAFSYCRGLTSVTIPDGVTDIGQYAFDGCTGLTSVTIPESVTSIGNSAFSHCTGLTSVTIPDSVTSIGSYAFQYCTGLTSVTIPDGVTSIERYVFFKCSFTSIMIPDSVTSIGLGAFESCSNLKDMTMSGNIERIGEDAFYGCVNLESVLFKWKTIEQVRSMKNYPWGIEDESVIQAEL